MIVGLAGMSYFSSPQKGPILNQAILLEENNSLDQSLLLLSNHNDDSMECTSNNNDNDTASTQNDSIPSILEWRCICLNSRQIGLGCAAIDGIWGGSILVPMHFARYDIFCVLIVLSLSLCVFVCVFSMLPFCGTRTHIFSCFFGSFFTLCVVGCLFVFCGVCML